MDFDEVTLNCLLAAGVDAPTAYAASAKDSEPVDSSLPHTIGLAAALLAVLFVICLIW